ncbi:MULTISPECIES: hypothetical protein [Carnobacterium]|uniref:Uncharacterized protein n=1 Tax=Carnobacterium antarcticum TaxID=2126436 RepID=A0ABW4NMR2_9LACT|nr:MULTISPECIES: hypothetical protein [unclassified Carnobacterium]ALV21019.1 hypothetical protein NY10_399 [Carnobacterium sp. CP1]QQP71167.1 hypothetical protein JHE06_05195 [Carnobacterium sp. CS13]
MNKENHELQSKQDDSASFLEEVKAPGFGVNPIPEGPEIQNPGEDPIDHPKAPEIEDEPLKEPTIPDIGKDPIDYPKAPQVEEPGDIPEKP